MSSIGHNHLPLDLPPRATIAHAIPNLASGSLLSIGQLCDSQCTAIFTDKNVKIYANDSVKITSNGAALLSGTRNAPTQPLYSIHLPSKTSPSINATMHIPSIQNRVAFYHGALFSPRIITWLEAHKQKFLDSWPALTSKQISKYGPLTSATVKGHQHAQRSNIRSTKKNNGSLPLTYAAAAANAEQIKPDPTSLRTRNVFASYEDITGKTFSDQTGRFICPSVSGNKYVFILYDYDSNSIHPIPIPSRTKHQIKIAFQTVVEDLKRRGFKPQLHRLDNECSELLENYMVEENIAFQLTPTYLHRRNLAERAIQTWKNHFISGLCSTHPDFPLNLWDKLIPQSKVTLNLLRRSRVNPHLSAHAQVYGNFDYNATPMAPPGIKVLVHEPVESRASSYSPHDIEGWYLGPSFKHYRQHRIWIPTTNSERIIDTVTWRPHNFHMPTSSATDIIISAAKDLSAALHQNVSSPLLPPINTETRKALIQLNDIFSNHIANKIPHSSKGVPSSSSALPHRPNQSVPRVPFTPASVPRVPPFTPPPTRISPSDQAPRVPSQPPPAPTTTSDFHNVSVFQRKVRRLRKKMKDASTKRITKTSAPSPSPPPHPSSSPPPRRSTRTRKVNQKYANINFTMGPLLPTPLRALINQEIQRTAQPTTSTFQRLNAVLDPTTGKMLEYRDLLKGDDREKWFNGCAKEFARLCNGRKADPTTKGTNTIKFKKPSQLPKGKKATYLRICANYRPQKSDPYRIRFTVGGNLVNYQGDTYTPTSDMVTAKILFNSVLSTPGAKFMGIDLANFYLITPFEKEEDFEYMYIPYWVFPDDIKEEYGIDELVENGQVLAVIQTGMYGLPQAGRLAYNKLVRHLKDAGYVPTGFTPGLFKHHTRPIIFSLVVDDFGVKYVRKEDVDHLISELSKHYDVEADWEGKIFCGLHLKWDYEKRTVDCSVPGYVTKGLQRFGHPTPSTPQHSPHPWNAPIYGKKVQYAKELAKNPHLTKEQKKYCQEVIGVFLWYGRAVDNTLLCPIGSISTSLSTSTWADLQPRISQFLDYCATHPNAAIRYHASDMQLWIHTDSSYLNEPKARSRMGGFFYLSDKPTYPIKPEDPPPRLNAPILVNSKILDVVASSAQESETGSGFFNAKDACPIITTLEEFGHPQGPAPLQFDNNTAVGIMTDTMSQKRSKAMDMRFYWLRDRAKRKQFHIHWKRGNQNLGDYFTKHHPTKHHQAMRSTYVINTIQKIQSQRSYPSITRESHCKGVLKPNSRYNRYTDVSLPSQTSDISRVGAAPYTGFHRVPKTSKHVFSSFSKLIK